MPLGPLQCGWITTSAKNPYPTYDKPLFGEALQPGLACLTGV